MTAPHATAPLRLCLRRHEQPAAQAGERRVAISLRVPTDLDVVEEAVDLVARHCVASGVPPHAARFTLRVVLCEALANAIVYGNRLDPAKCVEVSVEVEADALSLSVQDEGNGFDPGTVPDPTAPGLRAEEQGRGLYLIRQLVDEVQFNEQGNAICMIMRHA